MRIALAAALLLLAACDFDPRGLCTSSDECLSGQLCREGVCLAPEAAPPNGVPVATADAYEVPANGFLQLAEPGLLANDVDPDGDALVAERVDPPEHGVVYVEPSGAVHYVPEPGYTGVDAFTYRASDGAARSETTTVTLTVAVQP